MKMEVDKKTRKRARKGERKENKEKAPGTCFPSKEKNFRLPSSSEACKFCIESNTHSEPEGRVGIFSDDTNRAQWFSDIVKSLPWVDVSVDNTSHRHIIHRNVYEALCCAFPRPYR